MFVWLANLKKKKYLKIKFKAIIKFHLIHYLFTLELLFYQINAYIILVLIVITLITSLLFW